MPWEEAAPGIWRRELGGLEKVYRFAFQSFRNIGQEQWLLHAICTIDLGQGVNVAAALRAGWRALLEEYPGLTVTVENDQAMFRPQMLEDDAKLNQLVEKTFAVETARTAEEAMAEYQLRDLPALVYLQSSSEVMLLTSHWRVDATGCCLLLNRLLQLAVARPGPSDGGDAVADAVARLSPSMEDAAACPQHPSLDIAATADQVTGAFREAARKLLGLAYKGDGSTMPSKPATASIALSKEESRACIEACKRSGGISVSAAVLAALATAVVDRNPGVSDFTTLVAVDMRRHLPRPYDGPKHACSAYVTSLAPTVRDAARASFLSSARALSHQFKTWHSDAYNAALREVYTRAAGALQTAPPPPRPPHGITLSSLGIVDRLIANRGVTGFRFGVNVYTRQMLMYVWTFGGRLHMSINYNSAYYDAGTPRALLHDVCRTMAKGLDVQAQAPTA